MRAIRKLTLGYRIALGSVALLSITEYAVVSRRLHADALTVAVLEPWGRERMLVQRAALLATRLKDADALADRAHWREELVQLGASMADAHRQLVHDSQDPDLPAALSRSVRSILFEPPIRLDAQMQAFLEKIEALTWIDLASLPAQPEVDYLQSELLGQPIVAGLQAVVRAYEEQSEKSRRSLQRLTTWSLGLLLGIIAATGLLIFQPLVRRVRREMDHAVAEVVERERQASEAEQARTRAEQALADLSRLAAIVESSDDAIVGCRLDGVIVTWNSGARRTYGYTEEQAVFHSIDMLEPEEGAGLTAKLLDRVRRGEVVEPYEATHLRRDGSPIDVSLSLSPVWDVDSQLTGVSLIARDVSGRKSAEAALQSKTRELERSNRELAQFAYVASHDLREPLRLISSYVQLLERRYRGQLDPDADQFIRYTVEGVARMDQLIRDLLDYSRLGAQGRAFEAVPCDEVLERSLANLRLSIEETAAEITHDPLPSVHGDERQLVQLFQNLIGNAIKFRKPDRRPEIHVSAERADGGWRFAIRDNGIGIDSDSTERIFIIFQRLHTRDQYPGTGIGLAIAKKVVDLHGGRIWVESRRNEGSTFFFTLPPAGSRTHRDPVASSQTLS